MKDTIRKIDELVYGISRELFNDDKITLEDVLLALGQMHGFKIKETFFNFEVDVKFKDMDFFTWQLTKTLTQQSEKTQNTIKQIFEDGNK